MFAKEKCMNISNAQDVYTSLLGQLFIGEKNFAIQINLLS